MTSPFVAEIRIFAGNFAPTGWATCDGQLFPISQNTALFSLLGTTYGGNGKTSFGLPNFEGSAPMGQGQGPGLTDRVLGEIGGEQTVSLLQSEIPAHTHMLNAQAGAPDGDRPLPATALGAFAQTIYGSGPNVNLAPLTTTTPVGGNLPHNNMQPYLALTFIIALQGIFPPRS